MRSLPWLAGWIVLFVQTTGVVETAVASPGEAAGDEKLVIECFKVVTDGGFLLVPVEIRGNRYRFILDTGCSHTCYDKSFSELLRERVNSTKLRDPSDEVITVPIFRDPGGKLGKKIALPRGSKCFCIDLKQTREWSGQNFHGILGISFLKNHILRIDFDRGEAVFLRSVGPNPGQRVPVIMMPPPIDAPVVMVKGGNPRSRIVMPSIVDTGWLGFGSGSVQRDGFEDLIKEGFLKLGSQHRSGSVYGRVWTARTGWSGSIMLGGYRHEKLLFDEGTANRLGLNYWSRYVVTFDFPHNALYLKKGRQFDRPDRLVLDKSGLSIVRSKGQWVINDLAEGSPAEQAGVKPQDVLLKVDGAETSSMSFVGVMRLLHTEDKKRRLLIQRGVKKLELTILLREWNGKDVPKKVK